MKKRIYPYVPFFFCTFICLMALSGNVTSSSSLIPFYSFLPICFYHVGAIIREMQQENERLQAELQELSERIKKPLET